MVALSLAVGSLGSGCHEPAGDGAPPHRGAPGRPAMGSTGSTSSARSTASSPSPTATATADAGADARPLSRPTIAPPAGAQHLAQVFERTKLSYAPGLDATARQQDLVDQTKRALDLMGIDSLAAVRAEVVAAWKRANVVHTWQAVSELRTVDDDPVGVELTIPVWVPDGARRVPIFAGDQPSWVEHPADNLPHPSGWLWFCERLADINDKRRYQPRTLSITTNARHAPFVALLFDHVFREGLHDVQRRVPIVVLRSGEDCYSAERSSGPIHAECVSFEQPYGADFAHQTQRARYGSYGDLVKGCHVFRSNHRLGCALDVNNFDFTQSTDGATNTVTASARHKDRDRMHAIDARNLPQWFYDAAKAMGYRVPEDWFYGGARHDWTHIDLGRGQGLAAAPTSPDEEATRHRAGSSPHRPSGDD